MVVQPNWDAIVALIIPNIIGIVTAIPVIGQISNKDGTAWYQTLKKPSWILANWLFGPVYVIMYTSLGYASYLVYSEQTVAGSTELYPTAVYISHLLLTVIICFALYKFHKIGFSFFLKLVLDGLLLGMTVCFYQINTYSIIFLIPLALWQAYATLLIHALWVLNEKPADDCQILKA